MTEQTVRRSGCHHVEHDRYQHGRHGGHDADNADEAPTVSTTDVTVTSALSTSVSTTVVTETSTITAASSTILSTTDVTSSSSVVISTVYVTPSTTTIITQASSAQQSVVTVSSIVTETPSAPLNTPTPTVVVITSTQAPPPPTSTSTSSSSTSAQPSTLSAPGTLSTSSSGLGSGGKIAIAVVIPLVVIAAVVGLILFGLRKQRDRKDAETQRQNEIDDYRFNPNKDPHLAPVAVGYGESGSETAEDYGYRGWAPMSSTQRKPSTTIGSGTRGGPGLAVSDSSSHGGYGYAHSPPNGPGPAEMAENVAVGGASAMAAGGLASAATRNRPGDANIHRGPSNASSAYSQGARAPSDVSDGVGENMQAYYHDEVPYNIYNESSAQPGPFGDAPYGHQGAPVIRNVQAQRNPKIERVPTFPQPGNVGIAHNF